MQEFGELIRSLRKAKGMTLQEVALKVGTKKGYISGIENGKVNPPVPEKVRKLAKLLGGDRVLFLLLATIEKAPPETQDILRKGVKLAMAQKNPQGNNGTPWLEQKSTEPART